MPPHPRLAPGIDLIPGDDGYIAHDPAHDRVHHLNPTASLVIELCTGELDVDAIAVLVQEAFRLTDAPVDVVIEALAQLREARLIVDAGEAPRASTGD